MICVCAIAKNENRYLREFVEHYKKLGFDRIYLFDNNDEDGERFEDVISDYMKEGFVCVYNIRGEKPNIERPSIQIEAYNLFYNVGRPKDAEWIAYFDIDEFLTLPDDMSIREYLGQDKFKNFSMIHFRWVCYDDNGLLRYDDKPLQERFTHKCGGTGLIKDCENNKHIKTMVRGNLDAISFHGHPHSPLTYGACCDTNGKYIHNSWFPFTDFEVDETKDAYIKHFCIKTIEEFAWKRMRGFADRPKSMSDMVLTKNEFFKWNERTKEKEELYDSLIS